MASNIIIYIDASNTTFGTTYNYPSESQILIDQYDTNQDSAFENDSSILNIVLIVLLVVGALGILIFSVNIVKARKRDVDIMEQKHEHHHDIELGMNDNVSMNTKNSTNHTEHHHAHIIPSSRDDVKLERQNLEWRASSTRSCHGNTKRQKSSMEDASTKVNNDNHDDREIENDDDHRGGCHRLKISTDVEYPRDGGNSSKSHHQSILRKNHSNTGEDPVIRVHDELCCEVDSINKKMPPSDADKDEMNDESSLVSEDVVDILARVTTTPKGQCRSPARSPARRRSPACRRSPSCRRSPTITMNDINEFNCIHDKYLSQNKRFNRTTDGSEIKSKTSSETNDDKSENHTVQTSSSNPSLNRIESDVLSSSSSSKLRQSQYDSIVYNMSSYSSPSSSSTFETQIQNEKSENENKDRCYNSYNLSNTLCTQQGNNLSKSSSDEIHNVAPTPERRRPKDERYRKNNDTALKPIGSLVDKSFSKENILKKSTDISSVSNKTNGQRIQTISSNKSCMSSSSKSVCWSSDVGDVTPYKVSSAGRPSMAPISARPSTEFRRDEGTNDNTMIKPCIKTSTPSPLHARMRSLIDFSDSSDDGTSSLRELISLPPSSKSVISSTSKSVSWCDDEGIMPYKVSSTGRPSMIPTLSRPTTGKANDKNTNDDAFVHDGLKPSKIRSRLRAQIRSVMDSSFSINDETDTVV